MRLSGPPVLVATALLLAGCSSGAPGEGDSTFDDLDLQATDTTGVIRGVVVDEAIRPVVGATITLRGETPRETTSNEAGAFGFGALVPGTYFMEVSKFGYFPVQQSAEVVPGVAEPSITKVLLQPNNAVAPFWQALVFEGYIECTTSVLVLCGAPAILTGQNFTNDRFAWDQYFAGNASHLQAEMTWESTQAASPELYFEMEVLNSNCENEDDDIGLFLNSTRGPSPIYATVNETEIRAWNIGETCPIWMSIFSGGAGGTPAGFTVQQRFTMYFHTFHGHLPPPGWRFTADGSPPQPTV